MRAARSARARSVCAPGAGSSGPAGQADSLAQ
ncbi:Uncharacterised protein [Bordetella pertussis]|nr:Uncharacterised protein [Bordetella pertussis]